MSQSSSVAELRCQQLQYQILNLHMDVPIGYGRNPECRLWSLGECLRGWPHVKVPPAIILYYKVELGWYIHLLLKHVMGYGTQDGGDMRLHHVASLALLLLSFAFNGMHVGAYVLALLNISNPILHLAKIANEQVRQWLCHM